MDSTSAFLSSLDPKLIELMAVAADRCFDAAAAENFHVDMILWEDAEPSYRAAAIAAMDAAVNALQTAGFQIVARPN